MTLIRVILVAILAISPLVSSATAVADPKKDVYTGKEGAACHVVKGDNKGKSGTYDSAGDCAGDFGATVCKDLNGKPNGFCADGAKIGGGKGNTHELLTDLLLDQVRLFTDQNKILANLSSLKTIVDGIRIKLDGLTATLGPNLFCTLPDLTPSPRPGADPRVPGSFCQLDDTGNLVVQVKNQAGVPAGPSTTRVTFPTPSGDVERNLDTPPLGGFGGFVNLSTPIPAGCLPGDGVCNFHITADAAHAVEESDEGNNDFDGSCAILF